MFAAKKENDYMLLTTPRFKFLDVKNYVGPGLSLDAWFRSMGSQWVAKVNVPIQMIG